MLTGRARHAFQTQFGLGGCDIQVPRFELLLKGDSLEILYPRSIFYATQSLIRCRVMWLVVLDLDADDWAEVWDYPFTHLIFTRDRLIQYTFLHRIYYTPEKYLPLHYSTFSQCWCCPASPDCKDIHIFWGCPTISVCLVDLVERIGHTRVSRTLLSLPTS